MRIISFLDSSDILTTVTLDGNQYKIRMLWNDIGQYWTLSLRTVDNESLLEGIKCVPDFRLLRPYHRPGIPAGELMIVAIDASLQTVGRSDFVNSKAKLVYVTEDEINAIQ